MDKRAYQDMFGTTIILFIFLGFAAGLAGLLVFVDYGDHISQLTARSSAVTNLIEKAFLILAESVSNIIFSVIGVVMLFFLKNFDLLKKLTVFSLIFKLVFSLFLYLTYHRTWYFILDPNGSHSWVYTIIILSFLQFVSLVILFKSFIGTGEKK